MQLTESSRMVVAVVEEEAFYSFEFVAELVTEVASRACLSSSGVVMG